MGAKGTGKTGKLVEMANEAARNAKGNVIFIDGDAGRMLEVDHSIRFINTDEFKVNQLDVFYGFLSGLIAGNYDIEKIYMDALLELAETNVESIHTFIEELKTLSERYSVDFVATISCTDEDAPEFLRPYII